MANIILDKNEKQISNFDIIDLHQTVNGQSLFVVVDIENLDVRYYHDLKRVYEYNVEDLFRKCKFSGEVDFEIVGKLDESKKSEISEIEEYIYSEKEFSKFVFSLISELESRKNNIIKNKEQMTVHLLEGGCIAFDSAIDCIKQFSSQFKKD